MNLSPHHTFCSRCSLLFISKIPKQVIYTPCLHVFLLPFIPQCTPIPLSSHCSTKADAFKKPNRHISLTKQTHFSLILLDLLRKFFPIEEHIFLYKKHLLPWPTLLQHLRLYTVSLRGSDSSTRTLNGNVLLQETWFQVSFSTLFFFPR